MFILFRELSSNVNILLNSLALFTVVTILGFIVCYVAKKLSLKIISRLVQKTNTI